MNEAVLEGIKIHNSQFFSESERELWEQRKLLNIKGIRVPQYIYNGVVDPLDHSTSVFEYIMQNKASFEGKRILDIGTGAGINNILLTKEGFDVIGLDNNIYSINCALYVMDMNNVYYKMFLGDHNDIEKMDYDVLVINQMDYLVDFVREIKPILKKERARGKFVMMTRTMYGEV